MVKIFNNFGEWKQKKNYSLTRKLARKKNKRRRESHGWLNTKLKTIKILKKILKKKKMRKKRRIVSIILRSSSTVLGWNFSFLGWVNLFRKRFESSKKHMEFEKPINRPLKSVKTVKTLANFKFDLFYREIRIVESILWENLLDGHWKLVRIKEKFIFLKRTHVCLSVQG